MPPSAIARPHLLSPLVGCGRLLVPGLAILAFATLARVRQEQELSIVARRAWIPAFEPA